MTGESDPLLGNRTPLPGCPVTADFNRPRAAGLRHRFAGLPQFVTVRGGAYFFPRAGALYAISPPWGANRNPRRAVGSCHTASLMLMMGPR